MKHYILLIISISIFLGDLNAQLYINEVSQGTGNKEYVELVVVGTPTCTDSTVNLQGWILDDNCGFFGTNGIAGGHIKFANDPQWANIKYGTLIVIFRGDDVFPGIVADETDSNNDDIFVLPSNSMLFDRNENIPIGGTAIATYTTTGYVSGGGLWQMLGMSNGGDAFQTVSPTDLTTAFHSVGWGGSISGTDIYFSGSASGLSFVNQNLVDNDPTNQANWVSVNASSQGTPSSTNSPPNMIWINSLLNASASSSTTLVIDTTICFGDSLFVSSDWQTNTGTYYDTIFATGSGGSTTDTIYSENFEGVSSFTLNTSDESGISPTANDNAWIINNTFLGGSFTIFGVITVIVPPTPDQPGTFTGGPQSNYLHIVSNYAIANSGPANSNYLAGASAIGGSDGMHFCKMTNDVSTVGYSNINLDLSYLSAMGSSWGRIYYSINSGTSWTQVGGNLNNNNWTAVNINNPIFDNQASLRFGFGFNDIDNSATAADPAFAVDEIFITGDMTTSGGCDSIIQTNLTVLSAPIEMAADIVTCDSAVYNGTTYYVSTGFFADSIYNSTGCLVSYTNVGIDIHNTINATTSTSICANDSIFLAGAWQTSTGTYYDTLTTSIFPNCDSILATILTVENTPVTNQNIAICANDSVYLANAWQHTAGVYFDTIANGLCDSIVESTLTINQFLVDTVNVGFCSGDIFTYILPDGLTVFGTGVYNSTIANMGTCDSLITTIISVSSPVVINNINICTNNLASVGIVNDTFLNVNSCDSFINITNTYLITPVFTTPVNTCTNDITQAGVITDTILSIGNCDSLYQITTTTFIVPFYTTGNNTCTNISNQAGIDSVSTMQSVGGCDSVFTISETVFVAVSNINTDTSICQGEAVVLFGNSQTQAGVYSDTVFSSLGCDSIIENKTLYVNPLPTVNAGLDETITVGNSINLTAIGALNYVWSTNETTESITVSPVETTIYTVTGTDANNCINTDEVEVVVNELEVELMIPTAFSPNGDGTNDTFRIANNQYFEKINLRIYNRWGELLFQSTENITGWDGTYKSVNQELDSYIYYIDAIDKGTQKKQSATGSFSLIR